jgi:hypothetical protein
VISDFLAEHVWHLEFFIIATALRGTFVSCEVYEALESWITANGGMWLRLGVADVNAQALRFWSKMGYMTRGTWQGTVAGKQLPLRLMLKRLVEAPWFSYFDQVPQDLRNSCVVVAADARHRTELT